MFDFWRWVRCKITRTPRVVSRATKFQSIGWYDKLVRGQITYVQFATLTPEDLCDIVEVTYEDGSVRVFHGRKEVSHTPGSK